MTTTTLALAVGLAVCLLALVGLCLVVVSLRRQVRGLTGALRDADPQVTSPPGPQPHTEAARADGREVAVPVITALPAERSAVEPAGSRWRLASITLGEPLVKIVSFSYAVRRALDDERRLRYRVALRKELRRQRKLRRQRRLRPAGQGWRP